MPIYTYRCRLCGSEVEKLRPMSKRDDVVECSYCEGRSEPIVVASNWKRGTGWHARMDGAPKPGRG